MLDAVLLVIRTYDEEKNCNEAYSPKLTLIKTFKGFIVNEKNKH